MRPAGECAERQKVPCPRTENGKPLDLVRRPARCTPLQGRSESAWPGDASRKQLLGRSAGRPRISHMFAGATLGLLMEIDRDATLEGVYAVYVAIAIAA